MDSQPDGDRTIHAELDGSKDLWLTMPDGARLRLRKNTWVPGTSPATDSWVGYIPDPPAPRSAAYARYVNARLEIEKTQQGEYTPGAVEEMQAAMLEALQSRDPLPEEMRLHLLFGFEHLCEGVAFDLFTPVKRPGGRESPIFKKTQEAAIRYLRWCDDGRKKQIEDVGTAYGVNAKTVLNWLNAWAEKPIPSLKPIENYSSVDETARIKRLMEISGKQYQRFKKFRKDE